MEKANYQFSYQLSLENFREFNYQVAIQSIKKAEKKMKLFGIIEIVIACLYFFTFLINKQSVSANYVLLASLVLLIGLLSYFYYPIFFKKKMEKMLVKTFSTSDYFKSKITVSFFETFCNEFTEVGEKDTDYKKFIALKETENLVVLLFNQTSGILLPKQAIDSTVYPAFIQFLKTKIEKK